MKNRFFNFPKLYRDDLAFIRENKDRIAAQNRSLLLPMAVFYAAAQVFYLAASLFVDSPPSLTLLILCFIGIQVLFIIWLSVRKARGNNSYRSVFIDCMLFSLIIQTLVITVSVFASPDTVGILFFPLLICMALLYTLPFVAIYACVTIYALIFLLLSYFFKPYDVFVLDMIGTITSWVIALISNYTTLRLRIDDARSSAKLAKLSAIDPLTKLMNKITTQMLCEDYINDTDNFTPSAFIIFDIDDYKNINDTCGHRVGDSFLEGFSALIVEVFTRRGRDSIIGRFGGDEFVVLAKDVFDNETAQALCSEVCRRTREELGREFKLNISCSAGIAMIPNSSQKYDEIFDRADKALYNVKDSGKNGFALWYENAMVSETYL